MSDTQQIGKAEVEPDSPISDGAPRSAPTTDGELSSGCVLANKYQLEHEIGRGGMGTVWRAEHLGWRAAVAVKLMTRSGARKPGARKRFEREARLAATLRSPHVVQILDHGVDEATGVPFMVMELLEGESLATRLRTRGRLTPAETLDVVVQLSRALTRAHASGIVHRDLKPDNLFLVSNAEETLVKILDFGVGKWLEPNLPESFETRPGTLVGSPLYMSPEQIRSASTIDHRADLWSVATIVSECLTGRRPFSAEDFAALAVMICGEGPRPLPSSFGAVPVGFDEWFARATAHNIDERPQSAQELTESLRGVCTGPSSNRITPTEQLATTGRSWARPFAASVGPHSPSNWRWRRLGLGVAIGTALGGVFFLLLATRPPAAISAAAPRTTPSPAPAVLQQQSTARVSLLAEASTPQLADTSRPPADSILRAATLAPPLKIRTKKRSKLNQASRKSLRRRRIAKETAPQSKPNAVAPVVNGHAIRTLLEVTRP